MNPKLDPKPTYANTINGNLADPLKISEYIGKARDMGYSYILIDKIIYRISKNDQFIEMVADANILEAKEEIVYQNPIGVGNKPQRNIGDFGIALWYWPADTPQPNHLLPAETINIHVDVSTQALFYQNDGDDNSRDFIKHIFMPLVQEWLKSKGLYKQNFKIFKVWKS